MINKSLGKIFALHRHEKRKGSQTVADFADISRTSLSEFENGKKNFSKEKIEKLYKAIGMEYIENNHADQLVADSVKHLYHQISFCKDNKQSYLYHKEIKEKVSYGESYITWLLGEFLYYIYQDNALYDFKKTMKILEDNENCINDEMLQIMYDCIGLYYKKHQNYNEAKIYYDKGLKKNVTKSVEAMLLYHKTSILTLMGNLSESLTDIKKAKRYFDKELNFHRSIMCSIVMAIIYSRLGNYKKAETIYLQCIEAEELIDYPKWKQMITYNNLLWNYLVGGYYEKVIENKELLNILPEKNKYPEIYSYFSYAYYRLGNIEKAKNYLKTSKQYLDDAGVKGGKFIEILNSILMEKPFSLLERKLLELYEISMKYMDYQMQLLALNLLVEFSEKEQEMEKELHYRKQVLELIGKIH